MQRVCGLGGFLTAEQVMYRSKNPSTAAKHAHRGFRSIAESFDETRDCICPHARAMEFPRTAIVHVPQRSPCPIEKLHVTVGLDRIGQNLAHRGQ
jgi:hypothetical protein